MWGNRKEQKELRDKDILGGRREANKLCRCQDGRQTKDRQRQAECKGKMEYIVDRRKEQRELRHTDEEQKLIIM